LPLLEENKAWLYFLQGTVRNEQAEEIHKGRSFMHWENFSQIDPEQFRMGLEVEQEHGTRFPKANVTNDDPVLTGKIAYAHLLEFPDYYTRLAELEKEAKIYWGIKD
jgi:hypothetical protein